MGFYWSIQRASGEVLLKPNKKKKTKTIETCKSRHQDTNDMMKNRELLVDDLDLQSGKYRWILVEITLNFHSEFSLWIFILNVHFKFSP